MTIPYHNDISLEDVDVDSRDPNIRGMTGSVMAAGTDDDRAEFIRNLKTGMAHDDAVDTMAVAIARRAQKVIGPTQEQL